MTLTDEQLAEIRGRLDVAESSRISAPSVGADYSPRQARDDIRALLDEVERLREAVIFARAAYRDEDSLGGDRILTVVLGEHEIGGES